jgi:hypothetical protein
LAPGNWQWLAVGGTGASSLGTAIQSGAVGTFTVGDAISSSPGNKGNSANVATGLSSRLSSCPTIADPCTVAGGNPHNIPPGDPCLVVFPAVDYHGCTGSCNITIEGFAQIYLESNSSGTDLEGCFVSAVQTNTVGSSTAPVLGALSPPYLIR